ncbi:MAG TPA: DUF2721 domain-containing protein [Pyrinomonadaceae bacterium]|nr:DUF2721 domain-containing protein [Pyrinomonadaceae bacterium]
MIRKFTHMEPLSSALAVLTAMITPAVLISACGALILSTSTRLGRVVDRVRALSDRFEELAAKGDDELALFEDRRAMIFDQLDKLTSRARILQRSMTVFYIALGLFVATSVAIGIVAFAGVRYSFAPVVMGLLGASCLFYGSMTLIFEARLAITSLRAEMDFIWQLGKHFAPSELAARHNSPHYRLRVKPRP